jgi:hypothetical protein
VCPGWAGARTEFHPHLPGQRGDHRADRARPAHRAGHHGYDPVAYFTDAVALAGRAELELSYGGVVWRFRNAGNRAAFAERPDVYMPQFGGYDPVGLTHAVAAPGHPQLWLIADNRLFMFHSTEARDAFAADPRHTAEVASAKWPIVLRSLVP